MLPGMHLTPIGDGLVLLEPNEALDPGEPGRLVEPLLERLQDLSARRLLYDLQNMPLLDQVYYDWLVHVQRACQIAGIELIAVNMRPTAAYGLAITLDQPPPFRCALDVDTARSLP